jgi:hypothetical protein
VTWPFLLLLLVLMVGNILPQVPALWVVRDCGLAMYVAVGLWLLACVHLWRGPLQQGAAPQRPGALAA